MKFLHCADLHIDSPLLGLPRYPGAPVEMMRAATRHAFTNIVDVAIEQRCAFAVIAGDIFDGDWQDFQTGLFFASELARLAEAQIPVYVVRGNHDALTRITRQLRLPANVHVFADREPQTLRDENSGFAVHGQSYSTSVITANLAATYPPPVPGLLNVAVLHTALDGRDGHDPYAPTTADELARKGHAYWALGHVHAREVVRADPWIVFPGNAQGRHARETGAKGCYVVDCDGDAVQAAKFIATDAARWAHQTIDMASVATEEALNDAGRKAVVAARATAEGRPLALRLTLRGRSRLYAKFGADSERITNDLRVTVMETGGQEVWLEKVKVDVAPELDLAELAKRDDPVGWALRGLEELGRSADAAREALDAALLELRPKLGVKGSDELRALCDGDQAAIGEVVRLARMKILAGLSGNEEA